MGVANLELTVRQYVWFKNRAGFSDTDIEKFLDGKIQLRLKPRTATERRVDLEQWLETENAVED